MATNFHVGQKVILIRDFEPDRRAEAPGDDIILPDLGRVYTVRQLHDDFGYSVVLLDEIVNRPRFYLDIFKVAEQGFDPDRFRAVVEPIPA